MRTSEKRMTAPGAKVRQLIAKLPKDRESTERFEVFSSKLHDRAFVLSAFRMAAAREWALDLHDRNMLRTILGLISDEAFRRELVKLYEHAIGADNRCPHCDRSLAVAA